MAKLEENLQVTGGTGPVGAALPGQIFGLSTLFQKNDTAP